MVLHRRCVLDRGAGLHCMVHDEGDNMIMTDKIEPWWHPYPARWSDLTGEDPAGERMDCPRCEGAGCRRCGWAGNVEVGGGDSGEPQE